MHNTISDFHILHQLGLEGRRTRAPRILSIFWRTPLPGWIKVNTDGSVAGSPTIAGAGGIFQTTRGFSSGLL
ncbi:hypothetical protein M5689_023675 [Euphorbia peplus]|nr:hypothetical protein M5689_023675 [Euphorbia peplus]